MKKLTISEQSHVVGGYNADECRRVQAVAATYEKMQENNLPVSNEAWNKWNEEYDLYCK